MMNIEESISNLLSYVGEYLDYDAASGPQCVDISKLHINNLCGSSPAWGGNVKTGWRGIRNGKVISDVNQWYIFQNTKTNYPARGSIMFWNTGIDGHTAVVLEANANRMKVIEQNYPTGNVVSIREISGNAAYAQASWITHKSTTLSSTDGLMNGGIPQTNISGVVGIKQPYDISLDIINKLSNIIDPTGIQRIRQAGYTGDINYIVSALSNSLDDINIKLKSREEELLKCNNNLKLCTSTLSFSTKFMSLWKSMPRSIQLTLTGLIAIIINTTLPILIKPDLSSQIYTWTLDKSIIGIPLSSIFSQTSITAILIMLISFMRSLSAKAKKELGE